MIQCKNNCSLDKFNGCCQCCPENQTCPEACGEDAAACEDAIFDEESGLQVFQKSQVATLNAISALVAHKKAVEEQEKNLKAALLSAMERFGIKKFESGILNLTYVEATVAHGVDSAKLKKKYPEAAADCAKDTPRAAYVKITLKDGGKDAG